MFLFFNLSKFDRYAKQTLEKTEGAIKNGQSRETGNIGYTRRKQTKQKTQHNMCLTPLCANKHK